MQWVGWKVKAQLLEFCKDIGKNSCWGLMESEMIGRDSWREKRWLDGNCGVGATYPTERYAQSCLLLQMGKDPWSPELQMLLSSPFAGLVLCKNSLLHLPAPEFKTKQVCLLGIPKAKPCPKLRAKKGQPDSCLYNHWTMGLLFLGIQKLDVSE